MTPFICTTCGTQHAAGAAPPPRCPICEDERQYVGAGGQAWTTLEALRRTHANTWRLREPNLFDLQTTPAFAIGQRAHLLRTPHGNILWDCLALLDEATEQIIHALGGVAAIAISHPHFYTTMAEWARAFACPVWLHAADRAHVLRPDPALRFWSGPTHALADGITLINAPGHFDGAAMLHWRDGAEGRGVLLAGDVIQLVPDAGSVSFMRSYPNLIPLPARAVTGIEAAIAPFAFDRIYNAFSPTGMRSGAKANVARSAERYRRWLKDDAPTP